MSNYSRRKSSRVGIFVGVALGMLATLVVYWFFLRETGDSFPWLTVLLLTLVLMTVGGAVGFLIQEFFVSKSLAVNNTQDGMVARSPIFTLIIVIAAFGLGLGSGFLVWGREARTSQETQTAQQPTATQGPVQRYDVPEDDDPSIGPADAPITIIEFSDFECPFCGRWYQEVFKKIRSEYPDEVRIVYRDFPLYSMHANAQPAAEAANCANEQGAYWEFHDKLFSNSNYGEAVYLQYAKELNLDTQKFQACIKSGKYAGEIQADYQYASELGVRSTPTFFLNGIPIVGAQPWESFKQVIDQELAGEIP